MATSMMELAHISSAITLMATTLSGSTASTVGTLSQGAQVAAPFQSAHNAQAGLRGSLFPNPVPANAQPEYSNPGLRLVYLVPIAAPMVNSTTRVLQSANPAVYTFPTALAVRTIHSVLVVHLVSTITEEPALYVTKQCTVAKHVGVIGIVIFVTLPLIFSCLMEHVAATLPIMKKTGRAIFFVIVLIQDA
mgnify:FL=1